MPVVVLLTKQPSCCDPLCPTRRGLYLTTAGLVCEQNADFGNCPGTALEYCSTGNTACCTKVKVTDATMSEARHSLLETDVATAWRVLAFIFLLLTPVVFWPFVARCLDRKLEIALPESPPSVHEPERSTGSNAGSSTFGVETGTPLQTLRSKRDIYVITSKVPELAPITLPVPQRV